MTEADNRFVTDMMRKFQGDLGEVKRDVTALTLRQSATEHFEQGLMAHIASIHAGIDEIKNDMRMVKRRLDLVDAE